MTSTVFVDQQTAIMAAWLNDVNGVTYVTVPALATSVAALATSVATSAATSAAALAASVAALATSTGSSLVGHIAGGTGAVARTVQSKERDTVSIFDFMTPAQIADTQLATPTLDLSAPMAAARAWLYGTSTTTGRGQLNFPAGIYRYSVSPDWGIRYAKIKSIGEVRLRYIGTGNAVIITDSLLESITDMEMSRFIVEAPSTALNGVYVESIHRSKLSFNVRGCGTGYSGLRVNFAVCTSFPDYICSNNANAIGGAQGWYLSATPTYGVYLDKRGVGETASYCLFINPVIEGVIKGAYIDNALGNSFVGGTMEGCSNQGTYLTPNAVENKFYGTDFESNTQHDIYCEGHRNTFTNTDTLFQVTFGASASGNQMSGGSHQNISLVTAAVKNFIGPLKINRLSTAGKVDDQVGLSVVSQIFNIGTSKISNGLVRSTTLNVTASPFVYTNVYNMPMLLALGGGTVSLVQFGRPSTSSSLVVGSSSAGTYYCSPGDTLTITYSVLPTLVEHSI